MFELKMYTKACAAILRSSFRTLFLTEFVEFYSLFVLSTAVCSHRPQNKTDSKELSLPHKSVSLKNASFNITFKKHFRIETCVAQVSKRNNLLTLIVFSICGSFCLVLLFSLFIGQSPLSHIALHLIQVS